MFYYFETSKKASFDTSVDAAPASACATTKLPVRAITKFKEGNYTGVNMSSILSAKQQADFAARGFSRRSFGRIATILTAGAALPFYDERALAQLSMVRNMPPDAVKINANENPLGPCPEAADAIYNAVTTGGRYMYEETYTLAETMAGI
jgi:hypothetical protein